MSQTRFSVDLDHSQVLSDRILAFLHAHPLEISVTLAITSLGGYALRHLIMPSYYPNIDGPSSNNLAFGMFLPYSWVLRLAELAADITTSQAIWPTFSLHMESCFMTSCKINMVRYARSRGCLGYVHVLNHSRNYKQHCWWMNAL
jgi:hypothetical protein